LVDIINTAFVLVDACVVADDVEVFEAEEALLEPDDPHAASTSMAAGSNANDARRTREPLCKKSFEARIGFVSCVVHTARCFGVLSPVNTRKRAARFTGPLATRSPSR
jgi:hypothetical protein